MQSKPIQQTIDDALRLLPTEELRGFCRPSDRALAELARRDALATEALELEDEKRVLLAEVQGSIQISRRLQKSGRGLPNESLLALNRTCVDLVRELQE